ncbi:MAG: selenium metabolism-associated LysR family transcriptional regulator [Deltaproteobacteria bacterium]|nr:selenium metabolism-associated LysR family transcriptional regulator [Deltaproteobacteria bacterium]
MLLPYLDIFCKVYELQSFSKAAASLYLTQPTVSTHIKALEEELSIKLFDRLARQVTPTKAGELLYGYARNIENLKKEAKEAMESFSGKLRGSLHIGGSTIPGEYLLPEIMSNFKKKCPQVMTILQIADTGRIADRVLEGEVEVGLVGAKGDDKRLESRRFIDDELIFVAHRSYPHESLSIDKLGTVPVIARERGSGSWASVEKALAAFGVNPENLNIVAEMGSTEALKRGIKSGMGLSVLSTIAVKDDLCSGSLKALKVEGFPLKRSLYVITHKKRAKSPICKAFLDFLSLDA